jgi:hypothetical protein
MRRASATWWMATAAALATSGLAASGHDPASPRQTLAPDASGPVASDSELRDFVDRYATDRAALARRYAFDQSPERFARLKRYYADWQTRLAGVEFDRLGVEGQIDHVLLRNRLAYELELLGREEGWLTEATPLLPFSKTITDLAEARTRMESLDPQKAAATLDALAAAIDDTRRRVEAGLGSSSAAGAGRRTGTNGAHPPIKATKLVAFRANEDLEGLQGALKTWFDYYAGYDPLFTWWAEAPHKKAGLALDAYRKTLREKVLELKPGEDEPIVGTPIGRQALLSDLGSEFIPYTPEELLKIGEREFAWCEAEMKKAAREMGLADDWKAALEKVKTLHVEPGRQTDLIRDQAREAERYVEEKDLITVPPLAKEVWRMQMMSPQRQKVNPFFTGGEVISVSFPTDTMDHDDKLMSMRGNNIHFARATVHHELIPGHHLQAFMTARYNSHRRAFGTPFWTEGWSLYWEMLLWDLGFPATPENKVGMLFWRMHRAARIIFSLRFQLGDWTPQQSIDFLVDRVGHERANAEAEVRRSFNGSYPPLYQLAYMMGGLQIKAMHTELVTSGRMTNRQFHDAIITGGSMPIELVRARLTRQALPRDFKTAWKYAGAIR